MTHSTTPPAPQTSAAAQMREAAWRKIDRMICEVPHGIPGPGRDALIAARDAVAVLPLPPDPHAAQIAALTEALASIAAKAEAIASDKETPNRGLWWQCADEARNALARIDAIQGQPNANRS